MRVDMDALIPALREHYPGRGLHLVQRTVLDVVDTKGDVVATIPFDVLTQIPTDEAGALAVVFDAIDSRRTFP